ncbi:MAG: hypothetical protein SZ59_C0004G0015 [candidate division TM6 bacterium GW2011_GWF2_28_16]|nr:MAG: hypothetical protein SZ59_C0004G0015 [candidate division TM6 bacterium GW2011_GWF2_28_16]
MREIKILHKIGVLALLASAFLPLGAVEIVSGTAAADQPFAAAIQAKAFDRYTGNFYVGTTTGGDVNRIISVAGNSATTFTGLSTFADAQQTVARVNGLFAIASADGTAADYIGFNTAAAAATGLSAIPTTGGGTTATTMFSAPLGASALDAHRICLTDGTIAVTVTKIAGGYYLKDAAWIAGAAPTGAYFFVRSCADVPANDFALLSGIKAFQVGAGPAFVGVGIFSAATQRPVAYNATKGAAAGDGAPLRFGTTIHADAVLDPTTNSVQDMFWDSELKTLFVASKLTTISSANVAAHRYIAISKVKFRNDGDDRIIISDVVPNAINAAAAATGVFASIKAAAAEAIGIKSPRIYKIRTMHTSTGKYYLIVNGKVAAANADVNGNAFYALRYDPTAAATIANGGTGQIVTNNTAGTLLADGFTLETAGAANTRLDGENTGSLTIGGGNAPWAAANAASDMEVVGDTVYVSYSAADRDDVTGLTDPGVWASSAMFNENGVIVGWTAWDRVMPTDGVVAANHGDRTPFFAIDAQTNKLWRVGLSAAAAVVNVTRSAWTTTGFTATSLPGKLNTTFGALTHKDITCVLDIPMNTPGISLASTFVDADSLASLAVFGGYEKVVFAKTSQALAAAGAGVIAQAPRTDFSVANMYVETNLVGAGTVRCLAASRSAAIGEGYFFAGTDNGLYVYAAATLGAGYNGTTAIDATLAAPFNVTWQHLASTKILGPVTAIESDGNYIYVVEQDVTPGSGITSKLWRLTIAPLASTMEGATCIPIAMSGKDEIPTNTLFTGIKLVAQGSAANADVALFITTNQGLLFPTAYVNGLITVDSALLNPNAPDRWNLIGSLAAYKALYSPKRVYTSVADGQGACSKVWAVSYEDAANSYFQNSKFHQYGTNIDGGELDLGTDVTGENVINYTNSSMATGTNTLTYLDRSTNFWSDGARRFFTGFDAAAYVAEGADYTMLRSLPYNAAEWNMTAPYQVADVAGKGLYWIENISGLGIILAGTTEGVVALE